MNFRYRAAETRESRDPRERLREDAIQNFVGGSVATDGEKVSKPSIVCAASQRSCFAGLHSSNDFKIDIRLAYPIQGGLREPATATASRRRIHDREKTFVHEGMSSIKPNRRQITVAPQRRA